jgi:hypothetical protein
MIWVYWENLPGKDMPAYIKLCIESMQANCGSQCVIMLVNPSNVEAYLPEINPRYKELHHDSSSVDSPKNIAIRTAYIRTALLHKYGGVWLDADTIVLEDFTPLLEVINEKGFMACHKTRTIDGISNGFMASVEGGHIITKYLKAQETLIDSKTSFYWGELGLRLLSPIVFNNINHYALLPESKFHPVIWEDWQVFFSNKGSDFIMDSRPIAITLFNSLFSKHKDYSILEHDLEGILQSDLLISKLFRAALDIK